MEKVAIRWDFYRDNHHITGATTVSSISVAEKIVEIMNAEHGDGTHWVELNHDDD
jgi:hypothetical protein